MVNKSSAEELQEASLRESISTEVSKVEEEIKNCKIYSPDDNTNNLFEKSLKIKLFGEEFEGYDVEQQAELLYAKLAYKKGLQKAISVAEEYEKEIENLNKQIQVFALRYINADEEYFNSLDELELAEYNDVNKRIDFITKLRGKLK